MMKLIIYFSLCFLLIDVPWCRSECLSSQCLQGISPFSCPEGTSYQEKVSMGGCCPGCVRFRGMVWFTISSQYFITQNLCQQVPMSNVKVRRRMNHLKQAHITPRKLTSPLASNSLSLKFSHVRQDWPVPMENVHNVCHIFIILKLGSLY